MVAHTLYRRRSMTQSLRLIAVCGLGLFLASFPRGVRAQAAVEQCLAEIPKPSWADAASLVFDQQFDQDREGKSFACQGYMRASTVRRAIDQFRQAVLYHDEKALREAVRFPVRFNTDDPANSSRVIRRELKTPAEWWPMQERYLTSRYIALITCASLRTVAVRYGRGGYGIVQGPGLVWWMIDSGSPDVRVTVVNIDDVTDSTVVSTCVPSAATPKR